MVLYIQNSNHHQKKKCSWQNCNFGELNRHIWLICRSAMTWKSNTLRKVSHLPRNYRLKDPKPQVKRAQINFHLHMETSTPRNISNHRLLEMIREVAWIDRTSMMRSLWERPSRMDFRSRETVHRSQDSNLLAVSSSHRINNKIPDNR